MVAALGTMPINARARAASLVVALLVAALIVMPASAAVEPGDGGAGAVVLGAKPSPKPRPTHAPTPGPTAAPTPVATPRRPTPSRTPVPTLRPAATPRPTTRPASTTPKASAAASQSPSATPDPPPAAGGLGLNGPAELLADLVASLGPEGMGVLKILLGLLGLGSAVLLLLVWRQRRSRRPPDLAPALSLLTQARTVPGRRSGPTAAQGEDAGLPRWLRPSLRAERTWQPPEARAWHDPVDELEPRHLGRARPPTVFADPLGDSAMRLVVRYDGVELLDLPNEAYAQILTQLGTGDEVEILEVDEPWTQVLTPAGQTGWLPTMAIGGSA